jgi:tyrosine-protein kinase Etk/Wzc
LTICAQLLGQGTGQEVGRSRAEPAGVATRQQIALVLDDILNTYVRQNVERRSAEAEKTLKFLETQLPALKTQVDSAEAAYNNYRQSRGSLDLSLETQGILKSLVEVENAAVLLKQERDELRQNFTPSTPGSRR